MRLIAVVPHLQSQLGWELFKKFLLVHHQTEDDVVWPVLRTHLKDDPDGVAVVDELEAEHSAIEPWFIAIDSQHRATRTRAVLLSSVMSKSWPRG